MNEDKFTEHAERALAKHKEAKPPVDPDAVHIYYKSEKKFLDTYADTFDYKLACREANLKPHEVRRNDYLMSELKILQDMVKKKHRMKVISGKFVELLEEFERKYKELGKDPDKAKECVQMAGNLTRMLDSGMRVNGEFRDIERDSGKQVQVNINLAGIDYNIKTDEDGREVDITQR